MTGVQTCALPIYRFKYVTNSSKDGFDIYLLTYNSKGRLADTKKIKSERYKSILI